MNSNDKCVAEEDSDGSLWLYIKRARVFECPCDWKYATAMVDIFTSNFHVRIGFETRRSSISTGIC